MEIKSRVRWLLKQITVKRLVILSAILIVLFFLYSLFIFNAEKFMGRQKIILFAQNEFSPATGAAVRVYVLDRTTGEPIENADVEVELRSKEILPVKKKLFKGRTNKRGTTDMKFNITKDLRDGDYRMTVRVRSPKGIDVVAKDVKIRRKAKILLTTDKPIYQPGQVIRIRALVLSPFNLEPIAGKEVTLEVDDAKANKVFKRIEVSNDYGIVAANFTLAEELNRGLFTIRAIVDEERQERKVEVKRYVLPKFKVDFWTDKDFYLPGEKGKGKVSANYFFGKPVSKASVEIVLFTYEINFTIFTRIIGETDEQGNYEFPLEIPDYFVGLPLEMDKGILFFNITVVDQAMHVEKIQRFVPVGREAIIIRVIPEGPKLKVGMRNPVYILTTYPDTTPAICSLKVEGKEVRTNSLGVATIAVTPLGPGAYRLAIQATDEFGNSASKVEYLPTEPGEEWIMLLTDKAVYQVGDTMHLQVLHWGGYATRTVFIDVIKNRQTILTKSLELNNTRASLDLDVTSDMVGTLEIHAYKIYSTTEIYRDRKRVIVNMPKDLKISLSLDKPLYKPGENATLTLQVSEDGIGKQAALGVNIVDESVFALEEMRPGLEKIYFLLIGQLLRPRYQIKGIAIEGIVEPTLKIENETLLPPRVSEDERQKAARVYVSPLTGFATYPIKEDSYVAKQEWARKARGGLFLQVFSWMPGSIVISIIIAGGITLFKLKKFKLELWSFLKLGGVVFLLTIFFSILAFFSRVAVIAIVIALPYLLLIIFLVSIVLLLYGAYQISRIEPVFGIPLIAVCVIFTFIVFALLTWQMGLTREDLSNIAEGIRLGLLSFEELLGVGFVMLLFVLFIILVPLFFLPFSVAIPGFKLLWAGKRRIGTALLFVACFLVVFEFGLLPTVAALSIGPVGGALRSMMGIARMEAISAGVAGEIRKFRIEERIPPLVVEKEVPPEVSEEEKPYLRQYFPETLYSNPFILTDGGGKATISLQMADSITTWRLTALANSLDGKLGGRSFGILVFQDFFVDIDLPVSLTQGDEISIPVAIYNYLDESQSVRLVLEEDDWFTLLDEREKVVDIGANDIDVVYFRINVTKHGLHRVTVWAYGTKLSDAISRKIEVLPDGKRIVEGVNGRLEGVVKKTITIPTHAIADTENIYVKIYPGFFSQAIEGLEKIFRMPFGCFEQTTSITYPNVLVLTYMKETGQINPELQMQAEYYIGVGYQRLLSFETPTAGGFDWRGRPPPKLLLTAYGLFEFVDMSKVYHIDEDLIPRVQRWIASQQKEDGHWENIQYLRFSANIANSDLTSTCFVTWSLLHSGYEGPEVGRGIDYIKSSISYEEDVDVYTLAVCANALVAWDKDDQVTKAVLEELHKRRIEENNTVHWESPEQFRKYNSFVGSRGRMKDIEATALIAIAFMNANYAITTATKALNYLVQVKDAFGTWGSTQATILSLKAFVIATQKAPTIAKANVEIWMNGERRATLAINETNWDVLQIVSLREYAKRGENEIELRMDGEGVLFYQIVSDYYIPWKEVPVEEKLIRIDVSYNTTTLRINDLVKVNVRINYFGVGVITMLIVDLGIPPGFDVLREDLDKLVAQEKIDSYDIAGRQIILYVGRITKEEPLEFSYRLRARNPIRAKTPSSQTYDYYNPEVRDEAAPIEITVIS
jgi:uncharacterized protein YfaS (alpha-2-macroglobulin family)